MNLIMHIFGRVIKPLFNIGLGQIPGVQSLYKFVWRLFGPKGIKLAEVDGMNLYIICRDWAVAPTMLFAHTWEPAETNIFKQHIKKGMTVIDAGAYIGFYSILASRLVGEAGKVYAFEPSPESLELLYKNIELNDCKNIQVLKKALSDEVRHTAFYLSPQNPSGSTMFANCSTPGSSQNPQIEVATTTLDDIIGDGKVDFIKMDIEGGEMKALKGMSNIIKNNPNLMIMVEVFPNGLLEIGSSLEEYIGLLQRYFRLYFVDGGNEVGLGEIKQETDRIKVINLFCIRRKVLG